MQRTTVYVSTRQCLTELTKIQSFKMQTTDGSDQRCSNPVQHGARRMWRTSVCAGCVVCVSGHTEAKREMPGTLVRARPVRSGHGGKTEEAGMKTSTSVTISERGGKEWDAELTGSPSGELFLSGKIGEAEFGGGAPPEPRGTGTRSTASGAPGLIPAGERTSTTRRGF